MIKHLYCDVIPDAVSIIDLNSLQVLGYPTLSDTFRYRVAVTDFGVAMLDPRPHGGSVRIGTDNPDIGILLLQIKGDSRQSPTGTNRCNKSSDFLFGLMPELGPGCPVMSQSVGNIIELIRPKTVGRFFSHSILHRTAWIEKFCLPQYFASGRVRQSAQTNQWSSPDRLTKSLRDESVRCIFGRNGDAHEKDRITVSELGNLLRAPIKLSRKKAAKKDS